MVQLGLPIPVLATIGSIFMELPVAFAIAIGAFTRPAAALMALYSLGTALIGHRYWIVKGGDCVDSLESFLQRPQHYGRFPAVVHYWRGKIFDRCFAGRRRAITFGPIGPTMQRHVAYVRYPTCDPRSHRHPPPTGRNVLLLNGRAACLTRAKERRRSDPAVIINNQKPPAARLPLQV